MANVYDRFGELGVTLPTPPARGGLYAPVLEFGDKLLYCSGCGPQIDGTSIDGKLGQDLTVEQGQTVAAGERVALSGATGNSTGPHLHFELKLNGVLLNPLYYIETN